ncbi:MAG: hypothetical protein HKL87_08375 [Acidimicrobiaceae bacterium]|nr:hypothetical protein [Acidimicrobiaceae bacterium]
MTHPNDDLFSLLHGELDGPTTRAVAAHLRGCPECTDELIDVAVATGSLAALARSSADVNETDFRALSSVTPLRPLSPPARIPTLLAVAAALLAVVALSVGLLHRGPTTPAPVATAQLTSLDAPVGAAGRAIVVLSGQSDQMSVTTRGLAPTGPGQFYEVWLFQPTTQKMLPVGVLGPSGRGQYSVATSIMAHYSAIDISLQADNGNPRHSAVSALRGAVHPT